MYYKYHIVYIIKCIIFLIYIYIISHCRITSTLTTISVPTHVLIYILSSYSWSFYTNPPSAFLLSLTHISGTGFHLKPTPTCVFLLRDSVLFAQKNKYSQTNHMFAISPYSVISLADNHHRHEKRQLMGFDAPAK